MKKIDLGERCAVITGGAQGIGRALAERFLASGAARWLLRAIKFAPKRDAVPYQNLGRLYLRGDRAVDAFRVLAQCKVLFPENQVPYELLAWVYVQQGFYDEGIRAAKVEAAAVYRIPAKGAITDRQQAVVVDAAAARGQPVVCGVHSNWIVSGSKPLPGLNQIPHRFCGDSRDFSTEWPLRGGKIARKNYVRKMANCCTLACTDPTDDSWQQAVLRKGCYFQDAGELRTERSGHMSLDKPATSLAGETLRLLIRRVHGLAGHSPGHVVNRFVGDCDWITFSRYRLPHSGQTIP